MLFCTEKAVSINKLHDMKYKTEPNKMKVREEKLRTIIEWSEKTKM